jgi:hypothetical protein
MKEDKGRMKWIDIQWKGAVCQVNAQLVYSLAPPILAQATTYECAIQ